MLSGISLTVALIFANFTHEKIDKKGIFLITANSSRILKEGHFDRTIHIPKKMDCTVLINWKDAIDTNMIQQVSKSFI